MNIYIYLALYISLLYWSTLRDLDIFIYIHRLCRHVSTHRLYRPTGISVFYSFFFLLLFFFYLFWYSFVWLANAPQGFNDTTRRCWMLIFYSLIYKYIFARGGGFHISHTPHPAHSGVPFLISSAQFPPPHLFHLSVRAVMCVYITSRPFLQHLLL